MMSETVVTVESGNRNNAQAPPKPAAPQQSAAGPLSWITFNTAYFQSVPGLLKLIQLVSVNLKRCESHESIDFDCENYFTC